MLWSELKLNAPVAVELTLFVQFLCKWLVTAVKNPDATLANETPFVVMKKKIPIGAAIIAQKLILNRLVRVQLIHDHSLNLVR